MGRGLGKFRGSRRAGEDRKFARTFFRECLRSLIKEVWRVW